MECPKCDFEGVEEDVISHHTRIHKGKKTFYCSDCRSTPKFEGGRAYYLHRKKVHNDTRSDMPKEVLEFLRTEYECENCGESFFRSPSHCYGERPLFCSQECYRDAGASWWNRECGGMETLVCNHCGGEFERRTSHVNSSKNNGMFCSIACRNAAYYSGEDSPHYVDGSGSDRNYGFSWPTQRRKARKRDFYRCRVCNISDEECKERFGSELHVHHQTPFREFEDSERAHRLDNLLTVCPKCHGVLEAEHLS
jgi:5-methylcytosine-specific restriction endonuclease McrA